MAKKSPQPAMSAEEKRWQIEHDAETLRRAEEIKADPKRMGPARKKLTEMDKYIKAATKTK
jgi:hypothetical protein